MKKKRSGVILAAAAITGFAIFIYLVPRYSPLYSIDSRLDRGEAIAFSQKVAGKIGADLTDNLMQSTTFGSDGLSLGYLGSKIGTDETNAIVRTDSLPLNYWQVMWFDPDEQTTNGTRLEVRISAAGRLIGFRRHVSDTIPGSILEQKTALTAFDQFWDRRDLTGLTGVNLAAWKLKDSEPVKLDHRQDWTLTYVKDTVNLHGLTEELKARIEDNDIISLDLSYSPPEQFRTLYSARSSPFIFLSFSSWIVVFVLFAVGLVIFLKRYNEGEAGIGSSFFVAGSYYAAALITVILSIPSIGSGVMIGDMNIFYKSIIVAASILVLWYPMHSILAFSSWGVGESSSRAIWPDKLFTFDALSHGKIFNARLGGSALRGYAFGGILLGLFAAAHPLLHLSGSIVSQGGAVSIPDTYFPSVVVLADALATALFCEIFYRFGILSYFGKKKIAKGIGVSALLFIPSVFYPLPFGEYTALPRIVFSLALSAALILLFLRYDFITVLVASAIFCSAQELIPVFASTNSFFVTNSIASIVLLALPIGLAIVALWKKQPFELTVDLMPAHIRRISERERMAKELEIAKNVQNNLLPKATPSIPELEFGGICIPALEVGGDYYDFVQMHGGLIGTAIADVSGKGLPAAIYMTLTKGALQASAEDQPSPREVLSKINSIVYKSISRGTFISMIYAVIDTKTHNVKFARAGHNPLALFSSGGNPVKLFTPNGLALGLDDGEKFDSTLEEMEITLHPGDALVFYTDGFTEAMDSQSNEFGEDRLVDLIESSRHLQVEEMLQRIDAGVRKFAGSAPQHDDMTMVVIKVKAE